MMFNYAWYKPADTEFTIAQRFYQALSIAGIIAAYAIIVFYTYELPKDDELLIQRYL